MKCPGAKLFAICHHLDVCWSWENWEVKCFIFILSPPLLKLNFLFPWFLRGFNYEDDQLIVLDPWLNTQPSIKFVGRKASLRPTFCQLDGEGGSEVESEDRQVDARSPSSSSPSSPPTPATPEVKVKRPMKYWFCFNTWQSILSNEGEVRQLHERICHEMVTVIYLK